MYLIRKLKGKLTIDFWCILLQNLISPKAQAHTWRSRPMYLVAPSKDKNFRRVASHFLEDFSKLTGHFGLWKDWQTVYQHFSFGCVERAYLGRTMIRIWSKFMFLFLPPGDLGFAYMTLSLTRMRWRQKAALNTEPELSPTIQEWSGLARTAKMNF